MRYKILGEMVSSFSDFSDVLFSGSVSGVVLLAELDRLYAEWKNDDDFYFFVEEECAAKLTELKSAVDETEFFRRLFGESHRGVVLLVDRERGGVQLWEGGPYWADRNIGAERPEDYGYYFWWGDTVGYKRVNDEWVASNDTKPKNDPFMWTPVFRRSFGDLHNEGWLTIDNLLSAARDAAQGHWGDDWRMPTGAELEDLRCKCSWTWAPRNGINGYVITGQGAYSAREIFLPASYDFVGSAGAYWSSDPDQDSVGVCNVCGMCFTQIHYFIRFFDCRSGLSVRPVRTGENTVPSSRSYNQWENLPQRLSLEKLREMEEEYENLKRQL